MFKNFKNSDIDKENCDNININLTLNIQKINSNTLKQAIKGRKINNTNINFINAENIKQYPILIEENKPKNHHSKRIIPNLSKEAKNEKTSKNPKIFPKKTEKIENFNEIIDKIKKINPFLKKIFELKEGEILIKNKPKHLIKKPKKVKKNPLIKEEIAKPEIFAFKEEKIKKIDELIAKNLKKIRKEHLICEEKSNEEKSNKLKKEIFLREKNKTIREINKTRFLNRLKSTNVMNFIPKTMHFDMKKEESLTCRTLHKKRAKSPEELTTLREFMKKKRQNFRCFSLEKKALKKRDFSQEKKALKKRNFSQENLFVKKREISQENFVAKKRDFSQKKNIFENEVFCDEKSIKNERIDKRKVWKTAAIFIQKFWKGYRTQKLYKQILKENKYKENYEYNCYFPSKDTNDLVQYRDFTKESFNEQNPVAFSEENSNKKEKEKEKRGIFIEKNPDISIEKFLEKNLKENQAISIENIFNKDLEEKKLFSSEKNAFFDVNSSIKEKENQVISIDNFLDKELEEKPFSDEIHERKESLIEISASSLHNSCKDLEFHTIYSENPRKALNIEISLDEGKNSINIKNNEFLTFERKIPIGKSHIFLQKSSQISKKIVESSPRNSSFFREKWGNIKPRVLLGSLDINQMKKALKISENVMKIRKNSKKFEKKEILKGFKDIISFLHQAKIDSVLLSKFEKKDHRIQIKNCFSEGDIFQSLGSISVSEGISPENSLKNSNINKFSKKCKRFTVKTENCQNCQNSPKIPETGFLEKKNENFSIPDEKIMFFEEKTPKKIEKTFDLSPKENQSKDLSKSLIFKSKEIIEDFDSEITEISKKIVENDFSLQFQAANPELSLFEQIPCNFSQEIDLSSEKPLFRPNESIKNPLISSPLQCSKPLVFPLKNSLEKELETNDKITEEVLEILIQELLKNPLFCKGFSNKSLLKIVENSEKSPKSPQKDFFLEGSGQNKKKSLIPEVSAISLIKSKFNDIFLEYLIQFKSIILYEDPSIKEIMLNNLHKPLGVSSLEKLRKSRENASNFSVLLAENAILPFLDRKVLFEPILPMEFFKKIHQQIAVNYGDFDEDYFKSVFNALNDVLNGYRPFGFRNRPYIWQRSGRKFTNEKKLSEEELEEIIEKSLNKIEEFPQFLCGIFIDKENFLRKGNGNFEDFIAKTREEKMKKMLMKEIGENCEDWHDYCDDELELKIEISNLVYEDLMTGLIEELMSFKRN